MNLNGGIGGNNDDYDVSLFSKAPTMTLYSEENVVKSYQLWKRESKLSLTTVPIIMAHHF